MTDQQRLLDSKFRLLIMVFTIGVASIPLMSTQIPRGHDFWYHIARLVGVAEGLKSGQFPVRIIEGSMNGHGYGSPLFYPDLFLYIPAILNIMGIPIGTAYKLYILLCIITMFYTTYICSKLIIKDTTIALGMTMLFVLSQYNLGNIYVRSAVGEFQATVFIPLIIYGFYNFIYEEFDKPHYLAIGFIGISYSHTISVLLAAIVGAIWILININKILTPKKILTMIGCIIIVLLGTAGFYIMLFEQMASGEFIYSTPWTYVSKRPLSVYDLFKVSYRGLGINLYVLLIGCILGNSHIQKNANQVEYGGGGTTL